MCVSCLCSEWNLFISMYFTCTGSNYIKLLQKSLSSVNCIGNVFVCSVERISIFLSTATKGSRGETFPGNSGCYLYPHNNSIVTRQSFKNTDASWFIVYQYGISKLCIKQAISAVSSCGLTAAVISPQGGHWLSEILILFDSTRNNQTWMWPRPVGVFTRY